ncbi:MAG: hypothetical protein CMP98_09465 [Gammaproteobacteria bacterium]|nr:hypothetical protein [Gammaproteobacteria bacterium]OUU08776.1 MAG: hypothetical protein CBB94_09695 [Gammaproteobacteria bacterium TMED34]
MAVSTGTDTQAIETDRKSTIGIADMNTAYEDTATVGITVTSSIIETSTEIIAIAVFLSGTGGNSFIVPANEMATE